MNWSVAAAIERPDRAGNSECSGVQQATLLDTILPRFEFHGSVAMTIRATPAAIFRALNDVTVDDMPVARTLAALRYLPARLTGHWATVHAAPAPFLQQLLSPEGGNLLLATEPDQEVVIGVVGRLHSLVNQRFAALKEHPAYEKFVQSLRITGGDEGCGYRVIAEHRTHALSPAARRLFALYWWLLIKPGSAILLRLLLAAVKQRAERPGEYTTAPVG
jgi:hypothetical protein